MATARSNAVITAETVNVLCRVCGAAQPDPEAGSEFWTVEQVRAANGRESQCVSCESPVRIVTTTKIQMR